MIVITGCAGFIGYHLTKKLLEKKKFVLGIDKIDNYYDKELKITRIKNLKKNKKFIFKKIDLNNKKKLFELLKNKSIDYIIHLAAQPGVRVSLKSPHNTLYQNINTFINVIEAVRIFKIKKFIYASSSSVYGETKTYPFIENDKHNFPISVYGTSKICNEHIAETYAKNFKTKSVGLRFFTVYGPYGRPDMAYFSFTKNLYKDKKIVVFNKGKMHRDFTYVDDIVDGIYKIINKNIKTIHCVLNLGKGKPDKLFDLLKYLQFHSKKKFKLSFTKSIPTGDIKKTYASVKKAKKIISWKPKVNLKQGTLNFINWYRMFYDKK